MGTLTHQGSICLAYLRLAHIHCTCPSIYGVASASAWTSTYLTKLVWLYYYYNLTHQYHVDNFNVSLCSSYGPLSSRLSEHLVPTFKFY